MKGPDDMSINIFSHNGSGVSIEYSRDNRAIGIKNYSSANNIMNISEMERHLQTDEQFLLFDGSCIIVTINKEGQKEILSLSSMETGKIYSIPRGLWHTTVMTPGTRMILIENAGTTVENSERFYLTEEQKTDIRDRISEM